MTLWAVRTAEEARDSSGVMGSGVLFMMACVPPTMPQELLVARPPERRRCRRRHFHPLCLKGCSTRRQRMCREVVLTMRVGAASCEVQALDCFTCALPSEPSKQVVHVALAARYGSP